jgi:hypothetical protein
MRTWRRTLAALTMIIAAGCCRDVARPQFLNPGNAPTQRVRAQHFDPYPENETGPPIPEARPRDFERPPPQTARGRWDTFGRDRYGPGIDGTESYAPAVDGQ